MDPQYKRLSKQPETMSACVSNMRRAAQGTVMMDSGGNTYSATPGDYFMVADHEILRDDHGNRMILVRQMPVEFAPAREAHDYVL